MTDRATLDPSTDRASMEGVCGLLQTILADLERAPRPQPAPRPEKHAEPVPDPGAHMHDASLGALLDRLDERSFGLLFLILALPCVPPFVYGLPQIVSVPMLLLAGQMAAGRRTPWFPEKLRRRRFSIGVLRDVVIRMEKYIRFFERFAHPRLRPVTGHGAAPIIGALLLIPSASIMLPLPMTNTVPGIGIAVAALGLIERDGILVILGLLIGIGWVALLITGAMFLGLESYHLVLDRLSDWFAGRP